MKKLINEYFNNHTLSFIGSNNFHCFLKQFIINAMNSLLIPVIDKFIAAITIKTLAITAIVVDNILSRLVIVHC